MTAAQQDAPAPRSFTDSVAEELRVHLTRRRVTGRELARRLGVSSQWISQRTRGIVALSTDDIERIANALGMSPMQLLEGVVNQPITEPNTRRYSAASSATRRRLTLVSDLPADYRPVSTEDSGRVTDSTSGVNHAHAA